MKYMAYFGQQSFIIYKKRRGPLVKQEAKAQCVVDVEYFPNLTMKKYEGDDKPSFPIGLLESLGVAAKPLYQLVSKAISSSDGQSGLYYVNTKHMPMFSAKDGTGFIGALHDKNNRLVGQARMTKMPMTIDPCALATAIAIMAIEQKLNDIAEKQKEVIAFLELKEEARIKANVDALTDIINNYKYNYENTQYIASNHSLVKTIKKEADESIILFDELLTKKIKEKTDVHFDDKVENDISDSVNKLNDYQLALYAFAFSSLLDCILLKNFDTSFLKSILTAINERQAKYIATLGAMKDKISHDSRTSVQTSLIGGISKISVEVGKVANKAPLLNGTHLGNALINVSKTLSQSKEDKISRKAAILSDTRKDLLQPFVESIKCIQAVYNSSVNLVFDRERVYLDVSEAEA